jgi:hypothetical protein
MGMEFPNLICATCNSPMEETGKVLRRLDPGPLILCTNCRTYYQMFGEGDTVYIVPMYREAVSQIADEKTLKEKIVEAKTVNDFLSSLK